jgi:hypothetical protein
MGKPSAPKPQLHSLNVALHSRRDPKASSPLLNSAGSPSRSRCQECPKPHP